MVKIIVSIIVVMLVTATVALVLYVRATTISEANPVLLTAAQGPIEELSQWKMNWKQPENEFKKAEIILDEPDLLKVRFEHRYAGGHEGKVFACGAIGLRKEHVKWSCRPAAINVGDGVATVTFQTSKNAGDVECSNLLVITIYESGNMPFYSNYFEYNKKWLRGEKGLLVKLKEYISSCPQPQA